MKACLIFCTFSWLSKSCMDSCVNKICNFLFHVELVVGVLNCVGGLSQKINGEQKKQTIEHWCSKELSLHWMSVILELVVVVLCDVRQELQCIYWWWSFLELVERNLQRWSFLELGKNYSVFMSGGVYWNQAGATLQL